MAIAGGNITLDSTEGMDRITQTEKVTSPYFSDGSTTLAAANLVSSSLTATNETYFFGISNSSTLTTEEFNVAFGDSEGHGGLTDSDNVKSPTEAIYKQYASLLLAPTEVTGGFIISSPGSDSAVSSGKDEEIYVVSARRSNMKDRLNKGTWTVALSGSTSLSNGDGAQLSGSSLLELTDDSVNNDPTATPAGDRYNIVSGAAGTVAKASTEKNFGFFYPDMGVMVFSGAELSASIPGLDAGKAVSYTHLTMPTKCSV